jgi:L-rhamnose mutarotase
MERFAFRLRVRPERIQDYESAHRRVWPELLQLLKDVGISEYSIFRRGTDLFFYMRVDDFDRAWSEIDRSPVNLRWQKEMAPLFEPMSDLLPGERFAMLREVFYLE